jgi:hypothetical protein
LIQLRLKEKADPYPASIRPSGWDTTPEGKIAKVFEFSSELGAQEFSLELLLCEHDRALSLCVSESGRLVDVTIGFVKLNTSAANSLAEEINDFYQATNEVR